MTAKFHEKQINLSQLTDCQQPEESDLKGLGWQVSLVALIILALILVPFTPQGNAQAAPKPVVSAGTIAYIANDDTELHLVQPDGSNDHVLWTAPLVGGVQSGVRFPAWRPDGTEIAFVSDMEQSKSLLQSDIFAIRPDGNGLRKITDPPLNSNLNSFPTGTVTVHVTNQNISDSLFIVYVQGASTPQSTTVTAGTSKDLIFQNVAIFPGKSQFPVAIDGITRWYGLPDTTTFQPGVNNSATLDINGSGYDDFGGILPVWRSDSAEVDFRLGQGCLGEGMPANPNPGSQWGDLLVSYSASMCSFDRGPTSALSDQIIYWDYLGDFPNGAFIQTAEGSSNGSILFDTGYGNYVYGERWLPDGSGILYSFNDGSCNCSNLFEYNLGSQQTTPITNFTDAYVGSFSISPDGQQIVFERYTVDPNPTSNPDAVPDLWLVNCNGSGAALFISNGRDPSWGEQASAPPPSQNQNIFMPLIVR